MTTEQAFESWLPVIGFEGLYEVSSLGRVRRVGRAARTGNGRGGGARLGLVLIPQKHRGGYLAVQLWKGGRMQRPLLHTIVAAAFIGPKPPGKEVNHIDGIKTHNEPPNLEYLTRSENMLHAYATGLRLPARMPTGEAHHNAKLTADQVREIKRLYVPNVYGAPRLAKQFHLNTKTVQHILAGKIWKEVTL